jgi:hypothetical protein
MNMPMDHLLKIINNRRLPGILILDLECRLLYSNREFPHLVPGSTGDNDQTDANGLTVSEEILRLCALVKHASLPRPPRSPGN